MRVRLLPSNVTTPSELQSLTGYVVNDTLAIDAGSLGFALGPREQLLVRNVIVTHSHIDHIASLPVFVAESFPFLQRPISVYSTRAVIDSLRANIFNDRIWPDFQQIILPNGEAAGLHYVEIEPPVPFEIDDIRITPVWVNHTVPTIGLALEDANSSVIFTSDTYLSEEIWRVANRLNNLRAVFTDVSYPDEMETLAEVSKHLTPRTLAIELSKMTKKVPVYATHLKPQFRAKVAEQISQLNRPEVTVVEIGHEYMF